jgi:uncharacterized protein
MISGMIDCDVHPVPSEASPFEPYIPESYRLAVSLHMDSMPSAGYKNPFGVTRRDVECADFDGIKKHLLDAHDLEYAMLNPERRNISETNSIAVGNAISTAVNSWTINEFLERDTRLFGAIVVNVNDPVYVQREVRRAAEHPRMVQVILAGESELPYGHPFFDPLLSTCEELGLVVAIHPGSEGAITPSTPVGRPRSYAEWHSGLPMTFQAHLINMVLEGVFERHPGLKVLMTEGGFGWLPHVMWRMDKNFKALRTTLPWLTQLPSEYILSNVRLTSQPMEEPATNAHLSEIFSMIQADRTLCYSSDFPHWDFDNPYEVFPKRIAEDLTNRILKENAAELYGLSTGQEKTK